MHCEERGIIGGDLTVMGVKNDYSYLVGTFTKGLKLIEDCYIKYSAVLPGVLRDIIYIPDLNSYFLSHSGQLWRKDINDSPPYVFMNVFCGCWTGASFQYSTLHKRLIVNRDNTTISAINLEAREVEIEVYKNFGEEINFFKLFGEHENRVISVTKDSLISLYQLDYGRKQGEIISQFQFPVDDSREQRIKSASICPKSEYILIEIGQICQPSHCSRMAIARLSDKNLTVIKCVDLLNQNLGAKLALECFGYIGSRVLWVGLTQENYAQAQVYELNSKTGVFRELVSMRAEVHVQYPMKIQKDDRDGYFYFVGSQGKIKRVFIR